ncbi:MAG: ImmA/IrrE family metallo-endopeptidase [Ruminococcus flavefaciens]|nr:ImmA/IrrE family metallo-endopeptidase [Ruminococcus flavefaciens]
MPIQDTPNLTDGQVDLIRRMIADQFNLDNLKESFPNPLLREDVLALLNRYCTVVYFPLNGEQNNGFHVKVPDKGGEEHHFVYINTAQTIEKQAFTAAHELGHIWKVDQLVAEECGTELNEELGEQIINRFAAELLIPRELFQTLYIREYERRQTEDGRIRVRDMFDLIVVLMDQFFAPSKAIIYRCWELGYIKQETRELLLGNTPALSKSTIESVVRETIRAKGYVQFENPTQKKSIDGLAALLNQAEECGCVSADKIQHLRALFDLTPPVADEQMNVLLT